MMNEPYEHKFHNHTAPSNQVQPVPPPPPPQPEEKPSRRRSRRSQKKRHSRGSLFLMTVGFLAIVYLVARYLVIPVLVWLNTLG
ncbi:MAG: hypothetical protein IJ083_02645 [Clostridia bacterium]|nr:hypothetical protein [Clostridia bacterium]